MAQCDESNCRFEGEAGFYAGLGDGVLTEKWLWGWWSKQLRDHVPRNRTADAVAGIEFQEQLIRCITRKNGLVPLTGVESMLNVVNRTVVSNGKRAVFVPSVEIECQQRNGRRHGGEND